jgi:hypothetical protein
METTIVVESTKGKAPISLQSLPTEKRGLHCDTCHRLNRIPHEVVNTSNVNTHREYKVPGYRVQQKIRLIIKVTKAMIASQVAKKIKRLALLY